MTESHRHTGLTPIVERHSAEVREGQLERTAALLARHLTGDGAVHLIRQPVLGADALKPLHVSDDIGELPSCERALIGIGKGGLPCLILHDRLGSGAEEVTQLQIQCRRCACLPVVKDQLPTCLGLPDGVEGGALPLGNGAHALEVLLMDQDAHTLLRLIAQDLLVRERRITDRQTIDVDLTAGLLHQLGETIEMPSGAMVMDRYDWIALPLRHGADDVGDPLLHLRIGALDRIELNRVGEAAGIYRRDGATAHTDPVVVAPHHDDGVTILGVPLLRITLPRETDPAGEHDHLVVPPDLATLLVLKGEERTDNQGLAKLISEV